VNESLFIFSIRFYISHVELLGSSRPSGLSLLGGGVWETNDDCLLMQQLSGLLVIYDDMKSFPFDNRSEKIFSL